MRIILLFIWLILLGTEPIKAQQPAYFTIGKDELKNEHVYSLHQTEDETIYITTDNGFFIYEHGTFRQLPAAEEQVGTSLFGLTQDANGTIYCYNLYGQLFRLENNQLKLAYTIPKEYRGPNTDFFFDDENRLLIKTTLLLLVDTEKWEVIKTYRDSLSQNPRYNGYSKEGELVFSYPFCMYEYKDGIVTRESIFPMKKGGEKIRGIYMFDDVELMVSDFRKKGGIGRVTIMKGDVDVSGVNIIEGRAWCQTDSWILVQDVMKGISAYHIDDERKLQEEKWFPNTFISTTSIGTKDKVLLGTFNRGIYIVPDKSVIAEKIIPEGVRCRTFCVNEGAVYFVTENNSIYQYDDELEVLFNQINAYPIDFIKYVNETNMPESYMEGAIYNSQYENAAFSGLKSIFQKKNGELIIANQHSIYYYGNKNNNPHRWISFGDYYKRTEPRHQKNYYRCNKKYQRISKLSYDETNDIIYVVNNGVLETLDGLAQSEFVWYGNKKIKTSDLANDQDVIYIGTHGQGVLSVEENKVNPYFTEKDGLINNRIRQIGIANKHLFVLHASGMQVLDMLTKKYYSIGLKEGVDENNIRNFEVEGDYLWLNTGTEIIKVDVRKLKQQEEKFNLLLDSISINDVKIQQDKNRFSYQQKNIAFHTNFKNILLENETQLWYRLEGTDGNWENRPIHDYLIQFKSLSPGDYTFRAYAKYRNQKSKEVTYTFRIIPPIWQRWWFYPLLVSVIGFLIYRYFRNREKQLQQINQASLAQETAEREQIESELKALRSQMNPHFIFNSLNSIQDLILDEETDKSYDYIVRFAELVRNTLNYSNQKFISIEKELDFLEVYLSLEKLRFDEEFSYEINYNGDTDIQVPSLIVQPFIENALLHGLLHKKNDKKLKIDFKVEGDVLTCIVTDNGVGRERARQIRERQRPGHQSFSIESIKKRLKYLSGQFNREAFYTYTDLKEDGKASGTRVFIQMPYQKLY